MSDFMPGIADLRKIRHRTERITELEAESKGHLYALEQQGKQLKKVERELVEERARLAALIEAAQSAINHCSSCHGAGRSAIPRVPCPRCLGLRDALDAAGKKKP